MFTWLLLVLLAWSQASFAVHQFEHAIDDAGEACAVCLQFERNDDVIPDTGVAAPLQASSYSVTADAVVAERAEGFSHYRSRASP